MASIRRGIGELLERLLALLLIVTLSPVLVALYLYVRALVGSPAIYRQLRLGLGARPFWIYKFSTMRPSVEREPRVAKDVRDARIVRWAGWLRHWKLDELPQMFNILRGEMSFIGPRPLPLTESLLCPPLHRVRFRVKPGLSGLWQATVPSTVPLWKKFELDARYVRIKSFRTDVYLFFRTFVFLPFSEDNG